jgi:hypothetical protein
VRIHCRTADADPLRECTVNAAADGDGFLEVTGLPPGPWRVTPLLDGAGDAVVVEESAEIVELRF